MQTQINTIRHAISTLADSEHGNDYRLFLEYRDGRGTIENPRFEYIEGGEGRTKGFSMVFEAQDGVTERIGSDESPLPLELIDATQDGEGLVIVSLINDKPAMAQRLTTEVQRDRQRPHAR